MTPILKTILAKIEKIAADEDRSSRDLLSQFLVERALVRIVADSPLSQSLIFNGDYVALRVFGAQRGTNALQALCLGSVEEAADRIKAALARDVGDWAWFHIEDSDRPAGNDSIRLLIHTGLGEKPTDLIDALTIRVELASADFVPQGSSCVTTSYTIGEGSFTWRIAPVESMVAEKLYTLVSTNGENLKSKDLYDIEFFWPQVRIHPFLMALNSTFHSRRRSRPSSFAEAVSGIDLRSIRLHWPTAVGSTKYPPKVEDVFEAIKIKMSDLDKALSQ